MRGPLRTLLGQTAVYGLGGVVAQAIGVITVPIFARSLTASEFGTYEIYAVGIAMAIVVVDAGLGAAAQRSFYDYRDGQLAERRSVITTAFVASTTISTLAAAALYAAREPLAEWLIAGEPDATVVAIAAITLPLLAVANMTREVLRLTMRPWRYITSTMLAILVGSVLGIVAVTALDGGVRGILLGICIGWGLAAVYGIVSTRTYLHGRFDRHRLATMLRFGLPLLPGLLALWSTAYVDRLLLARMEDLDAVGFYAIGARIAAPVLLLLGAFITAYHPYLLSMRVDQPAEERELRGRIATLLAATLLLAGLPLTVFGPELISVLTPGYGPAAAAIGPLALGIAAYGVASVFGVVALIHRRTHIAALLIVVMGVGNVVLCLALIPPFGLRGAAIASFCAYASLAVMYWYWSRTLEDTRYEPWKLVVAFALAAAAYEAWRIDLDSEAVTVLLKLLVCGAFLVALRLAHIVRPADLGATREIVTARLRARSGG